MEDIRVLIAECKALIEQTEPYQRKMKAKHSRLKKRVIGRGGQANVPPFTKKPSMKRSKSAPPIGEAKKKTHRLDKEYDVKALEKGTKVEMEHEKGISNKKRAHDTAEKIAKDHLDEDPKYYDKLEKVEKSVKEHIVKQGSKWCLKSKKSNKNLGCYSSKEGAKKRERQVQYFKHAK